MARITDDGSEFLGGRLLIAMPGIEDPRFERAVLLMCAHTPEHAIAITVNRPLELSTPDLLQRLGVTPNFAMQERPVLAGGPVERERGFVLHSNDYTAADSTLPVTDGVALTVTREVLEAMGDHNRRPERAVLALGHASWSSGQLEREIKDSIWLIADANDAIIFDEAHDTKWERALATLGVRADQLSAQAGHA